MTGADLQSHAIVIFGASGDLAHRKLFPALYHLFVENLQPPHFAVIGCARREMTREKFVEEVYQSLNKYALVAPDGDRWLLFKEHLYYVHGSFGDKEGLEPLRALLHQPELSTLESRLFYCATPPEAYPQIVHRVAELGLHWNARIVLEKPFGHDLESARELHAILHQVFQESQIFRIDHYLGKETVQNILAFRFSNGMFEPIWNRRYVNNVQITVAENIGIEGRGKFFDKTGTIRDMVQPHLFQVMTFIAMEPPVSFSPDRLRDEKVRVLHALQPVDPHKVIRGQFVGYRHNTDIAADSQTETYAAMQLEIDNWRWAGVPFNLRTGKMLRAKVTEISLSFRSVPYNVFQPTTARPQGRDALVFRVYPNEGITLHMNIKKPGVGLTLGRATMDFDYGRTFDTLHISAYERLILDVMQGDHTLFTREDEVEQSWEKLKPVLEKPPRVRFYEPRSWGPDEADELILPRHWHITSVVE